MSKQIFRVLCLHGMGTSSEILETQTAALRYKLGNQYDFDFIEGKHPWPAARGIGEVFGQDQVYYSYYDGSAQSITEAIQDLEEYISSEGPFDIVMGFSLGAAMAATMLLHYENQRGSPGAAKSPFKLGIFLCGTLPCDYDRLRRGEIVRLNPGEAQRVIQIPTIHAYSERDDDYPKQSRALAQLCETSKRVELLHSAGHSVPSQGVEVDQLAIAIQEMVALSVQ